MIETALTLEELVQKTKIKFEEHYGRPARWIVVAPGRVNIIGEHTDYNGGVVFPMGIERYTVLAADLPRKPLNDTVVVRCLRFNETAHIKLSYSFINKILPFTKPGVLYISKPSAALDIGSFLNIRLSSNLS